MMNTPIVARDLGKQAPHSPRQRVAGFVIANRTVDKCRASLAGTLGDYHYDCPLDNLLFDFKGITGAQFKAAAQSCASYEEVGRWLHAHGKTKKPAEIKIWSDEMEAASPMKNPDKRDFFIGKCTALGLNPKTATTFDWLEADDLASFPSRRDSCPLLSTAKASR